MRQRHLTMTFSDNNLTSNVGIPSSTLISPRVILDGSFNNSYLSALQNQPTGAVSHRQSSMPSTRSHYKDPFQ